MKKLAKVFLIVILVVGIGGGVAASQYSGIRFYVTFIWGFIPVISITGSFSTSTTDTDYYYTTASGQPAYYHSRIKQSQ